MTNTILHGDCIEKMRELPDNSVDSVVTDPPYELGFMGKSWDNTGIANNTEMWAECLRVLKPGGYLLSFGGTRTYHRMASAIEDAGFEVRDMIEWIYGSGFPKSLNIGKVTDKFLKTGNASWTASGGSIVARWLVIYVDATVNSIVKPILGYFLMDNTPADYTIASGDTRNWACDATNGWFKATKTP